VTKIERTALKYIERYIRYGFYRPAEVEQIVGDDVLGGKLPRKQVRQLVEAEVARQEAEQQSWPAVTDCDRLDQAFVTLRANGILAIHNAGLTPSEGIAEMSEQYRAAGGERSGIVGYCFYHRQDMEQALKTRNLGLAYGDIAGDAERGVEIGKRVRSALQLAGLRIRWSGSIDDKLEVLGFHWQRRRPG
jgi:Domain of unknown function (DUF6891)